MTLRVLALLLALLPAGCFQPDYTWTYKGPRAERNVWITVARPVMYEVCGWTYAQYPRLGGCTFMGTTCYTYSYFSENEAKSTMSGDGLTLWEHEVWNSDKSVGHCAGFVHQEPEARQR